MNYTNSTNTNNSEVNINTNTKIDDLSNKPCFMPTLCIPRLFNNVTEEIIRITMNNLRLGVIHKIMIINKKNKYGDNFKIAFIHFKKWNTDERTNNIRENLIKGKEVKIIYDDPWFWKVSAYKAPIKYDNSKFIPNASTLNNNNNSNNLFLEITLPRSPSTSPPSTPRKKNNEINK
jgi:hypothetical protein